MADRKHIGGNYNIEHSYHLVLAKRRSGKHLALSQGIRAFREVHVDAPVHFFKHMESGHFIELLKKCACLVGNSSVGNPGKAVHWESPVVNIGNRQCGQGKKRQCDRLQTGNRIHRYPRSNSSSPMAPMSLYISMEMGMPAKKIAHLLSHNIHYR